MTASYRGAVRQLLRDRLLDAGREQLGGRTWASVTMAEIAAAGGSAGRRSTTSSGLATSSARRW